MDFDFSKEPGKRQLIRGINAEGIPLVSIITPYYNAGKYFEQTYNCVMNQTFPWFEWIIVDDGSSEQKDIQILKDFAGKDNRIKIFHKENGGIASARNLGIKNSCTEIIIPLDADDLIKPTFVETVYWGLYFNSESAWCYTDSVGFQDDTYLWKKTFSPSVMKTDNQLVCTAGIRKGKLFDCGCYKEGVKHFNEDWMLWLKMLSKSYFPVHISEYGFWYRRTDGGVLHIVKSDSGVIRTNKQLISETASEVDTTVQAKEYPCANAPGKYIKPKLSDWGRRVFKTHDKIHVMMLLPWMEMGGADLFNLDVVRKIDKNKYEMSILTTVPASNSWQQRFEEYVTDIFNLPNFLDVQNYAEFISYFIKSREIDVLFLSNSYYGYYLLPWLRKEFPDLAIIDYVHMEEWYWRNGGYARTSGALGEILEKTYVCNERTRQVLINDFGREPESVETLYIGVDKDKFDESKVEAGLAKKMLGIESDRPVILFPCRIHPQKRPFLMLEIAKEVKKKITNIAFVVVGDGSQLEELKIKAKEASLSDTVYFADRQNDMLPFYKDAGITLICSLKEGLALTAYESLSMSTPVITSDVGGQSELIDDSVGAVLPLMQSEVEGLDEREFSQEEVSQYVQAVENILKDRDKYETMCKACRNRIEKNFSSDIMIRKLQDILDNLAHNDQSLMKRAKNSEIFRSIPHFVDDCVIIYNEFEVVQENCGIIWKSKECFRQLYENELAKEHGGCIEVVPADAAEAQRKLEEIYQMRTWRWIERYRHIMDDTIIGKILRKIINVFRGQG